MMVPKSPVPRVVGEGVDKGRGGGGSDIPHGLNLCLRWGRQQKGGAASVARGPTHKEGKEWVREDEGGGGRALCKKAKDPRIFGGRGGVHGGSCSGAVAEEGGVCVRRRGICGSSRVSPTAAHAVASSSSVTSSWVTRCEVAARRFQKSQKIHTTFIFSAHR